MMRFVTVCGVDTIMSSLGTIFCEVLGEEIAVQRRCETDHSHIRRIRVKLYARLIVKKSARTWENLLA